MSSDVDKETRERIEIAVQALAERDYPRVWIGEPGMTPDELMAQQLFDDEYRRKAWENMGSRARHEFWHAMPEELRETLPEQEREVPPAAWNDIPERVRSEIVDTLGVEPGEQVEIEDIGMGVRVPDVSIRWLDGRWVLENMPAALPDSGAELDREVLYIRAAKEGKVPVIYDTRERMEAGLGPLIELKAVGELTRLDVHELAPERVNTRYVCRLEALEFYAEDTMGPYVTEDSEKARWALEQRLGGDSDD